MSKFYNNGFRGTVELVADQPNNNLKCTFCDLQINSGELCEFCGTMMNANYDIDYKCKLIIFTNYKYEHRPLFIIELMKEELDKISKVKIYNFTCLRVNPYGFLDINKNCSNIGTINISGWHKSHSNVEIHTQYNISDNMFTNVNIMIGYKQYSNINRSLYYNHNLLESHEEYNEKIDDIDEQYKQIELDKKYGPGSDVYLKAKKNFESNAKKL